MSDSLTATKVETNQCPSHQSILLTQGPIHEIFKKKYWELAELENEIFLRRPFWTFKSAILNFFFASSHWKMQPVSMRYHFFSALWMVFPESWKRSCPNFYAHDCSLTLCEVNSHAFIAFFCMYNVKKMTNVTCFFKVSVLPFLIWWFKSGFRV